MSGENPSIWRRFRGKSDVVTDKSKPEFQHLQTPQQKLENWRQKQWQEAIKPSTYQEIAQIRDEYSELIYQLALEQLDQLQPSTVVEENTVENAAMSGRKDTKARRPLATSVLQGTRPHVPTKINVEQHFSSREELSLSVDLNLLIEVSPLLLQDFAAVRRVVNIIDALPALMSVLKKHPKLNIDFDFNLSVLFVKVGTTGSTAYIENNYAHVKEDFISSLSTLTEDRSKPEMLSDALEYRLKMVNWFDQRVLITKRHPNSVVVPVIASYERFGSPTDGANWIQELEKIENGFSMISPTLFIDQAGRKAEIINKSNQK